MSLKNTFRLLITVSIFSGISMPSLAEYAEGALGYDWNPETKQFKRVYKDWQEGVVFDVKSGNYFVTYKDSYGEYNEIIFEPATKIDPTLKSKFKQIDARGAIVYDYKLKNGNQSKQNIDMFLVHVSSVNTGSQAGPKNWDGRAIPTLTDTNLRLSWTYESSEDLGGLKPGKTANGFRVESNDLPGIALVEVKGASQPPTWLGHFPDISTPVGSQVNELIVKDFLPRPAAVPLIPVPNPFDAAAVLTSMQKHVNQDLVSMKLIDPAFASQLDRLFQTAIAAAKGGNTVALKGNLKDLRRMLKSEHADADREDDQDWDNDDGKEKKKDKSRLIDKLAAKVLDFDLKYIEKRIKE